MRIRSAVPLLALAALLMAVPATAATTTVDVKDFSFSGGSPSISQGDDITWKNVGSFGHTSTRTSFPTWNLALATGNSAGRTFTQAGAFAYRCSIHASMTGTIKVRIKASPSSGTAATSFKITVATGAAAGGSQYVIQRKAPGGTFKTWKTTSSATVTFKSAVKGTWSFRSKVVKTSTGAGSGYSPSASVTIG